MGIYTKLLNENINNVSNITKSSIINDESLLFGSISLESVVYNEYLMNNSLLENCSNEDERKYLEEKTNILLEVSFKDIGDKIMKAIKFLKEKIKELIGKIKGFFKKEKLKKAQKDLTNAENKIRELDRENGILKEKLKDLSDEKEKSDKDYNDMKSAKERSDKDYNDMKTANDKTSKKISDIAAKAIGNKYIYFDINKYINFKNTMSLRNYFNSISYELKSSFNTYDDYKEKIADFKEITDSMSFENATILTKYAISNIDKDISNVELYNINDNLKSLINKDLEKSIKENSSITLKEFIELINQCLKDSNIEDNLIGSIAVFNDDLVKLENVAGMLYEYRQTKSTRNRYQPIDSFSDVVKCINTYINIIKQNIYVLSLLSNYESKKISSAMNYSELFSVILSDD